MNDEIANNRSKIIAHAKRYRSFEKEGAENTIMQGQEVAEVNDNFSKTDLAEFCEQVKLPKESSKFRKFLKIGRQAARLRQVVDMLPNCWTTLYMLAKLNADEFDRLVTSGQLHVSMTAADIESATSAAGPTTVKKCVLRIDVSDLGDGEKVDFFHELTAVTRKYGVRVVGSPNELNEILDGSLEKAA